MIESKKTDNGKLKAIIIAIAAVAAILISVITLFRKDNYMYVQLFSIELKKELLEVAIIAAVLALINFKIKNIRTVLLCDAAVIIIFCYLHSILIPMGATALYIIALLATGDIVLGIAMVITAECVLSLFQSGGIEEIRLFAIVFGVLVIARRIWVDKDRIYDFINGIKKTGCDFIYEKWSWDNLKIDTGMRITAIVLILVFLIQAGRMNLTLDFDSLWYGVRSDRVLVPGNSIYEDLGLVGVVYTYSKGFEILTLPFCGLRTFSYITFINLWFMVIGWYETYKLARHFTNQRMSLMAVLFTALFPAIANMAVSAKPDMITWMLQIIMLERFFASGEKTGRYSIAQAVPAYILSLAMKPTAVIYSTALFGMMFIFILFKKNRVNADERKDIIGNRKYYILTLVYASLSLIGVWGRTFKLTGLPFTSVFTSILTALGFTLKYPFNGSSVPQNFLYESPVAMVLRRIYGILLSPVGKDMSHVLIAWNGILLIILILAIILFRPKLSGAAKVVFIPFIAVNVISLVMLYQVDGNYFMTLVSVITVTACVAFAKLKDKNGKKIVRASVSVVLVLQLLLMCATNWASVLGFTPIMLNKGLYNHRVRQKAAMTLTIEDKQIWDILAQNKDTKVIAFAEHPYCLQFPCIVESYSDITEPWGNEEIVDSVEAFEEYMDFMDADYVYYQEIHFADGVWEWSKGLVEQMIADGTLIPVIEGENKLYEVQKY